MIMLNVIMTQSIMNEQVLGIYRLRCSVAVIGILCICCEGLGCGQTTESGKECDSRVDR